MKKIIHLLVASCLTLFSITALANLKDAPPQCPSSALLASKYPMISATRSKDYYWMWQAQSAIIPSFLNGNLYIDVGEATNKDDAIKIANEIEQASTQWNGVVEMKLGPPQSFVWECDYKIDDSHIEPGDAMHVTSSILPSPK